jgi:hypothetical protein
MPTDTIRLPPPNPRPQQSFFKASSPSSKEEEAAAVLARQRDLPVESRRRLGGFETFFAYAVPYGLGLIYYVVDMEGPADVELLRLSMRLAVKRHPNLRSRIVDGCVPVHVCMCVCVCVCVCVYVYARLCV